MFELAKTVHALDRAATVIGEIKNTRHENVWLKVKLSLPLINQ
jgi:hypothetical protein